MKLLHTMVLCLCLATAGQAAAQSLHLTQASYALKEGETQEISDLYWVLNCRSQLTGTPDVTVLEGPPGVTVSVTEAMVMPRIQQCARPVKGGKLVIKADKVEDQSNTSMTVRIRYPTKDGAREKSLTFDLALFPAS